MRGERGEGRGESGERTERERGKEISNRISFAESARVPGSFPEMDKVIQS